MSTGSLPLADVPDEELEAIGIDRPVTSVYDVVTLYGRINALVAGNRVEGDVSPEYVPYMTPDNEQIQDLYDEDNSLLNVHVDLSGDEPTLAEDELVTLERLTWQKAILTGYTRPINKRGPIIAHSIPHHANGKEADRTASYATDRLTRWPTDGRVRQAIPDDTDETSIIDHLAELGADEDAMEQVEDSVKKRVEDIGGTFEGLVSLRIRLKQDGSYRYPGEIDLVNEGMVAKKGARMKSYSSAADSSGNAADYVTNEVGTALGATPGSPVEYFYGKQTEKFPNLDPDAGYQLRPLAEDTAADIAAGQAYTAACSVYFGGGVEIRYLPYLDEIRDADDVRRLAELLTAALEGDQPFRNLLVSRLRERSRFAERLQLFQVVIATDLDRKDKIVADRSGIDAVRPLEIADEHIRLLDTWPHTAADHRGVFRGGNGLSDHFSLLDRENTGIPQSILSGRYFDETLYNPQRESDDPVFGPDDVRLQSTIALASRSHLPATQLRQSAVMRIIEKQNELLGDSDADREFPFYLVAEQHIQFSALQAVGAIDATDGLPAITPTSSMPDENASRDDLLEQFIENHPVLEDEERRTAFLLGALVGRLSAYQMREGVSTMISRYPVENITKRNIPRIVNQVLGKNAEYSEKEDGVGLMNMRYQRRLADLLTRSTPDKWGLSTDEIRMNYALGIAYGYADISDDEDDEEAAEATETARETTQS
jgi:hypothetical protein